MVPRRTFNFEITKQLFNWFYSNYAWDLPMTWTWTLRPWKADLFYARERCGWMKLIHKATKNVWGSLSIRHHKRKIHADASFTSISGDSWGYHHRYMLEGWWFWPIRQKICLLSQPIILVETEFNTQLQHVPSPGSSQFSSYPVHPFCSPGPRSVPGPAPTKAAHRVMMCPTLQALLFSSGVPTGTVHQLTWRRQYHRPQNRPKISGNVKPGLINPVYACLIGRVP